MEAVQAWGRQRTELNAAVRRRWTNGRSTGETLASYLMLFTVDNRCDGRRTQKASRGDHAMQPGMHLVKGCPPFEDANLQGRSR
ncbi:hypothetical protein cyc_05804 [Cyclospora cayetanensis]|uniref:Uncharacterized protein n=1 Tax=Cyclospora cayetanensis TaxID=88456 RepID=A0A1D3CVP9_9EIME|nr:hypothetical protein cyc_05804 [Cyclospora cayetanensis]